MPSKLFFVLLGIWITMTQATANSRSKREINWVISSRIKSLTSIALKSNEAADNFTQILQSKKTVAEQQFQQELNNAQGQISAAVANATASIANAGSNIQQVKQCILGGQQKGAALLKTSSEAVRGCFTKKIDSSINEIGGLRNVGKDAATGATEAFQEALRCAGSPWAVMCLGKLFVKTQTQVARYSFQFSHKFDRLGLQIPATVSAMQVCMKSSEMTQSTAKIVSEITSCNPKGSRMR